MSTSLKYKVLYFILIMISITTITYLNHFDNSFHFDDYHTITENPNIRSLTNITTFFTDGKTISSLPQNQSYRPVVTTSLAFDYWLANGYNPLFFHLSTFILFLLQGILIFFFTQKIINLSSKTSRSFFISCIIAIWYMIHPVMAETVNYIIARSDLQSTFCILLAFILYQYSPLAKKYHLFLIPVIIGALSKPTAIMFAPLLFCYVLLFEQKISFLDVFSPKSFKKLTQIVKQILPSIIVCSLLYVFIDMMTPDTYSTGSSKVYSYLISQPYAISYYFGSVFFPIHLSADTDWTVLESIWSYKFLTGMSIMIILVITAFLTSKKKKYRPISFGISWFFITLVPSSSIIPLSEVINDHRMFFPYVGLIISVGWAFGLLVDYIQRKYSLDNKSIVIFIGSLLIVYAFGTYQRNEVWNSNESLWKDVTIKSPKNGRGLMNYGLSQMAKGEYEIAEQYFKKALSLTPYYHTLYTNLGILSGAQGKPKDAEKYFNQAIKYGADYHTPWYYYGRFLQHNSRNQESIEKLLKSLKISPSHIETRLLLMKNYEVIEDWENLGKLATNTLQIDKSNIKAQLFLQSSIEKVSRLDTEEKMIATNPTTEKYLNLSLKYYQKKKYKKCIEAAEKAINLNPNSYQAYNNICTAQNLLGNYEKALEACYKAIELNSAYTLAKNNLNDVINKRTKTNNLIALIDLKPTEENYLDLSLLYYNYGLFEKCIEISKNGIAKHSNSDKLYNNICAAFNSLMNWEKAIEAGKKGLAINPENQLLRNNYNWAIENQKK
ncbi:tetratricopeptide repeat protein [Aquimarina sediminis]|uniref:tetratricopeptide repeat protein n=1 Tax=Aquimarina sediminis TaxID=2070536 RepID=UPI000FFF67C5|nr:tetratricopeptide repeat protein [Aquimarina sediminis]